MEAALGSSKQEVPDTRVKFCSGSTHCRLHLTSTEMFDIRLVGLSSKSFMAIFLSTETESRRSRREDIRHFLLRRFVHLPIGKIRTHMHKVPSVIVVYLILFVCLFVLFVY